MDKPKNYKSEFAKFVNINGEWKYYETEQDYIDLLNEENERLKRENDLLKADIEASQEIICDYKKEEERYKLIIKEIRELADKYEMGKYDYNVPSFEIKEILDKENKQ